MALDKIVGKWEEESKEGFDDFATALGVAEDKREFYKQSRMQLQYERCGDEWKTTLGLAGSPEGQVATFRLDQPYESASLDGAPMNSLVKADGDGFAETHTFKEGSPLHGVDLNIRRYVDPNDKMVVETTFKNLRMTTMLRRI